MTQRLKAPPTLPAWSREFLDAVRDDYVGRKITLAAILEKHGISDMELRAMINLDKWPVRGKGSQLVTPATRLYGPQKKRKLQFDAAALSKEARQREAMDDSKRYGNHLQDVNFLRARGVVIHVESNGVLRVGNVVKTKDELQAMADRERRLMQPVAR